MLKQNEKCILYLKQRDFLTTSTLGESHQDHRDRYEGIIADVKRSGRALASAHDCKAAEKYLKKQLKNTELNVCYVPVLNILISRFDCLAAWFQSVHTRFEGNSSVSSSFSAGFRLVLVVTNIVACYQDIIMALAAHPTTCDVRVTTNVQKIGSAFISWCASSAGSHSIITVVFLSSCSIRKKNVSFVARVHTQVNDHFTLH